MARPLALLSLALAACARPVPMGEDPAHLLGWSEAVDWTAAGEEAARLLAGYLRVDTINPPGNETRGARYLASILRQEGIDSEILELAPGRGSLLARLEGRGEQEPLCLLSHIDVAAAQPGQWPPGKGPLSGFVDSEGMIWGRGALDMKGMGMLELMTLVWLKRLGVPLVKDVVLLAVADEESRNRGMRHMVAQHWKRIGCSHVINEGGLGLRGALFADQTVFAISVAEKGVLWLRMKARGQGGHGSTPMPHYAPQRLVQALALLQRREPRSRMHPALLELFARVGRQRGGGVGLLLRRPDLIQRLLGALLLMRPGTRAVLTDTVSITGLHTGRHEPNVVPAEASATLDCRLLPGTSPRELLAELADLTAPVPGISFEQIFFAPASESPWRDPVFEALARQVVAGRSDAVAGPVLSPGFSDSLFARQMGARAYGLVPFEVTRQEAETMHGAGERVSVANVRRGLEVLLKVVLEVAADPGRPPPPRGRIIPLTRTVEPPDAGKGER